jgi:hypothetical protein
VVALTTRYASSNRVERGRILDEFVASACCNDRQRSSMEHSSAILRRISRMVSPAAKNA